MKHLMRSRANPHIRELLAEGGLSLTRLIQPIFVVEAMSGEEDIAGLVDNRRMGVQAALRQIEGDVKNGVRHFMLFPVPAQKGIAPNPGADIISTIKGAFGSDIHLWVDTCLCSSSPLGHCCLFQEDSQSKIDLEATLNTLGSYARAYAGAGADGIAPSDMMDGRVAAIRAQLDQHGHQDIPIMSYSTKFSSAFYGPFRAAADSTPNFGDRRQYQIDVRNRTDALNASMRCADEGADLLMLKPGMTSIDLLKPIFKKTSLAVGVYQVSGEYASLALLGREGLTDFNAALLETWHVFQRAGAQYIITYGARKGRDLGIALT
ncbi:MAG TPA: porphobilinogen synthase [Devosia sp.]|nr:porphobilinogen synthase [Devosia sp.]